MREGHPRRDRSEIGPQGSRGNSHGGQARYDSGVVPEARCLEVRWIEIPSSLRPTRHRCWLCSRKVRGRGLIWAILFSLVTQFLYWFEIVGELNEQQVGGC